MGDSTITKVDSANSPKGHLGQKYLASGKSVSMRLWDEQPGAEERAQKTAREYETVGYVLEGSADLELEGQTIRLNAGDSWVVPKGSQHSYHIKEHFRAIEATAPPAQVHGRDE